MLRIVLASQSPRRRELLEAAGYEFIVDPVKVSEILEKNLNLREAVTGIARTKVEACVQANKSMKGRGFLVIAADTMVILDGEALGKPRDFSQAVDYLTRLSGKTHSVITGLAVHDLDTGKSVSASEESQVTFRHLLAEEIKSYVDSGEAMDKAGAYGIQGAAGDFVMQVKGSWSNVVGLPMELLERVLKENGWRVARRTP